MPIPFKVLLFFFLTRKYIIQHAIELWLSKRGMRDMWVGLSPANVAEAVAYESVRVSNSG